MSNQPEIKELMKEWVKTLSRANPVARWVSPSVAELGINFDGHTETWVHQIGADYLVVTNGGGADLTIESYPSIAQVSLHLKQESRRGDPDDGWEFDLWEFNHIKDQYPLLPSEVKIIADAEEIVDLLTEWDDDLTEWLTCG